MFRHSGLHPKRQAAESRVAGNMWRLGFALGYGIRAINRRAAILTSRSIVEMVTRIIRRRQVSNLLPFSIIITIGSTLGPIAGLAGN